MIEQVGLQPLSHGSYGRFFTETLELAINFANVKLLARKSRVPVEAGVIAPATGDSNETSSVPARVTSIDGTTVFPTPVPSVRHANADGAASSATDAASTRAMRRMP